MERDLVRDGLRFKLAQHYIRRGACSAGWKSAASSPDWPLGLFNLC